MIFDKASENFSEAFFICKSFYIFAGSKHTDMEKELQKPPFCKTDVMPSAFTDDANKHTSCHHELKAGEMWVGNTDVRKGLSIPHYLIGKMQTARLGEQAYYIDGKPIHREYCRPLIIHKSEEMLYDKIMMARMSDAAK